MPKKSHQMSETKLYWIWGAMVQRCTNPKCAGYKDYGERGIYVCDDWMDSENFMNWAICNGYEEGLQLDRKDNDGPYSPGNCEFVTRQKNLSHTRHNVFATAFGETKYLREWSRDSRCKCKYRVLVKRICNRGWDHERAITQPEKEPRVVEAFGESKPIKEWASDQRCKCTLAALRNRISEGMDPEQAITSPNAERNTYEAFGESKTLEEWSIDSRCKCKLINLQLRITSRKWNPERAIITPVERKR